MLFLLDVLWIIRGQMIEKPVQKNLAKTEKNENSKLVQTKFKSNSRKNREE